MIKYGTDDQLTIQRLSDKVHDLEIKVKELETEIEEQEHAVKMFNALEIAGVDNWQGYDEALIEYENT